MSKSENVTLKVKPGASTGNGWTTTVASNGQQYCYKYSGGDGDNGNMTTTIGDGSANIQLTLDTDQRYGINGVNFNNDTYSQLSWAAQDSATGSITDINTQVETATYCVQVSDSQANDAIIPCDPMISNDPKHPMAQVMHQRR
jgi:hypothetical protein